MHESTADITDLIDQLASAQSDARALVTDLAEERGVWRLEPGSWSVAECLDHLAVTNRAYLQAMKEPAARALQDGKLRRRPARPGIVGSWFINSIEPPVKGSFKIKAPDAIKPHAALTLANALVSFETSQDEVRAFVSSYSSLDLASIRFRNPFIRGIRFSLATGLHVIAAHERRHLWQAWLVRRAA